MWADNWTAIAIGIRVLSVGTLLSSVEFLSRRDLLKDTGLMSWEIGRLRTPWLVKGLPAKLMNYAVSYPHVLWLCGIRALIAACMIMAPFQMITTWWAVSLAMTLSWLTVLRNSYGLDGADQMSYIFYTGLGIAVYAGTDRARDAFLWFMALESCLSYFVAGVAKAGSKGWRDGSYLIGICYTHIYGRHEVARYLSDRPLVARTLARLIITWEVLFPLVLFVPERVAVIILISGASFHIVNGFLMGLNTFIWSFTATYPAILYCIQRR